MLMIRKKTKILVECLIAITCDDNLVDATNVDEVMLVLQKIDNWHTQTSHLCSLTI